jgi:Flp pilus assembly protein TadG
MAKCKGIKTRLLVIAKRFAACRGGVAMVEFAIAMPILFILFAGGWEMARGLWLYEALNKSVRDASRYLARVDDPTTAGSLEMARRLVLTGDINTNQPARFNHNNITVTVDTKTFDNAAGTYRGPDGASANIKVVRVTAAMDFAAPLLFFLNTANPMTIKVMHEERHIGD